MTFDAILLTDTAVYPNWTRGYGAHRLASHLRAHGHSVLVIDFSIKLKFDTWQEICKYAIGDNTLFVGFSTTWWPYRNPAQDNPFVSPVVNMADNVSDFNMRDYPDEMTLTYDAVKGKSQRWIDEAKKYNERIKILIGGAKIDWYKDFPADYFFSGLGETQIMDFLTQKLRIWPKYIQHDTHADHHRWDWIHSSTRYTELDFIQPGEIMTLETARGCKFKCSFCSFPLIGQKKIADYTKTEDTLYRELLENWEKWGITNYWIADDTFNDNTEKLRMFKNITDRLPFELNYRAYLRLDVLAMHPEQIGLLYDSGIKNCWFGIETFHAEAAKSIGKGMPEDKRKNALYEMQKVWGDDVAVASGYIVGLPHEPKEHIYKQAEWFMEDNNPINHNPNFMPLIINPPGAYEHHPQSAIDKDPEKYGYKIPDMKRFNFWTKDDDTGIRSFEEAWEICADITQKMSTRTKIVDDPLKYEHGVKDPETEYFKPLVEKLKNGN